MCWRLVQPWLLFMLVISQEGRSVTSFDQGESNVELGTGSVRRKALGTYAIAYFGKFSGGQTTRSRTERYRADRKLTERAWKSIIDHVVLPNEGRTTGNSSSSSSGGGGGGGGEHGLAFVEKAQVDVFMHHWDCSLASWADETFNSGEDRGGWLVASSCDNETHGPYRGFQNWGGMLCEDIQVVANKMGVPVNPGKGQPEATQFCLWRSIQRVMALVRAAEDSTAKLTPLPRSDSSALYSNGMASAAFVATAHFRYRGVMLLRHDLYVTAPLHFREALQGVPPNAVVIPRQCPASGVSRGERRGSSPTCGNFLQVRREKRLHELDWVWWASSTKPLEYLAQLPDNWPPTEVVQMANNKTERRHYSGSHTAW